MKSIFILFIISFLFLPEILAQPAVVKVSGVKSQFLASDILFSKEKSKAFVQVKNCVEQFVLDRVTPGQIYLLGVNNRICFYQPVAGDTVKVDASGERFIFSGAGHKMNNYLSGLSDRLFYTLPNVLVNNYMSKVMCNAPQVDVERISQETYPAEMRKIMDDCLAGIRKSGIKDKVFRAEQERRINYMYQEFLTSTYINLKRQNRTASKSLVAAIDAMDLKDPALREFGAINTFISPFLQVQEELGKLTYTLSDYVAQNSKCIQDQELREYYVMNQLGYLVKGKQLINLPEIVESCAPLMVTEEGKRSFQELQRKALDLIEKDTLDRVPAYPFAFENQEGKIVQLSDYKGKYVYLDIWATWCGPCKQEIPRLQQLEKELEGKNIQFISISVDRPGDQEKWKTFLKEHNMHGTTLMTPNAFKAPFIQHYGINAIPRFMLISPDGIMISNNCWRPGDPRLKTYLNELLTKGL